MLPQSVSKTNNLNDNEVLDPVTDNIYFFSEGDVCVKSKTGNVTSRYPLPQHYQNEVKQKQTLRFKKIANSSIVFNPSGKSLTCKTDKIQEVDFSITFTKGIALWSICCSSNCLSLVVGVKNAQKKKQHCLEFSIQHTTTIIFKLDITAKKLKAWAHKPLSILQKKIDLSQDITEWTPFIRVKGAGVSVFLSDLVQDPEAKHSIYNVFGVRNNNFEPILQLSPKTENKVAQNFTLKLIDQNTLLLYSKFDIRLIRRPANERQFNFNFNQFSADGMFWIKFDQNEIEVLKQAGFKLEQQGSYSAKKIQDWVNWMISAFTMLDTNIRTPQTSGQLYLRAYQILLNKLETFKIYSKTEMNSSPALQSDIQANWGYNQSLLPCPKAKFTIPSTIKLNHQPPLKFPKIIKDVLWTQHYLIVYLGEIERLVVVNRQDTLFRVAEINLKRGFRKQNELNQYQKQLDMLASNNPNQPSIYKILKNCLKYADKVKLPQKQVKAIKQNAVVKPVQNQKQKKVKKDGLEPDVSLVNTLASMGFSQPQSKKALVEAKNNLQKAIQLILNNKVQVEPTKTPKVNNKSWDCEQCTFYNQDPTGTLQVCAMCNFPRPPPAAVSPKKQSQKMEEPKVQQVEQATADEEVESKNIEKDLTKIFAWELGYAYCPLIIAGAFGNRLRVRLFGPNPKYYSLFYNKDDEFVDSTHLSIYDAAAKIDQKPIRYQFYNTMTTNQQKQAAYGWISIQDQDIEVKGTIQNVTFNHIETTKDRVVFQIHIEASEGQNKYTKQLKGLIAVQKIYAEKKKALHFEASQAHKEESIENIDITEQLQERTQLNSKTIPKNGFLELRLAKKQGKEQLLNVNQTVAEIQQKIHQARSYLPIISAFENGSAQVATLSSTLRSGQKPLILKSLNNSLMSVDYVVLQKVGKHPTSSAYKGYIYFMEDTTKTPVNKISFELEKGKKKFYIQTKRATASSFVMVELISDQKQNQSALVQQISLVGLIGEQYERKNKKAAVKFLNITKLMKVCVGEVDSQQQNNKFKIQAEVINSTYDLNCLPAQQLEQTLQRFYKEGYVLDLRVQIFSLAGKDLQLKNFSFEGWDTVKMLAHWTKQNKMHLLQESYRENLHNFLETGDVNFIDCLIQQENRSYFKILLEDKYNLTAFLNKFVVGKKLERGKKNKISQFFHQISPYLVHINKSGNLDYTQVLKATLQSPQTDYSTLQLIFEIVKHFPIQEDLLIKDITNKMKNLKSKQQNKLQRVNKMGEQTANTEHVYRNLKQKQNGLSQNALYNRSILQVGKLYRKYTIDLVNLYKIQKIALNFEKSSKRSAFKVIIKSYDNYGNDKTQFEESYPQFVWDQVAVCPYMQQFQKTTKESKRTSKFNSLVLCLQNSFFSRFLEIEVIFGCHPNIGSLKDIQRVPQTEIIAQIFGEYAGQSSYSLPLFKQVDLTALTFMKNIAGISKFNVKSANNLYFFDNDQAQSGKNQSDVMQPAKPIQSQTNWVIATELDELISRGGDKYSQQFITNLLNALTSLQKGAIAQKIILLLRKIAKTNSDLASFIFKYKLPNQFIFNSIFRESSLTSQKIIQTLKNKPTNIQIDNSIYFAKNKQEKSKELMSEILKHALKQNKLDQTLVLHQKHSWVPETIKVLDLAIQNEKRKLFKSIVGFCAQNKQLSQYCKNLLQNNGFNEWYTFAFEELMKQTRKVKQEQVLGLFKAMITYIQNLLHNQENYEESQVLQNFTNVLSAMNKLDIKDKDIIESIINLFSLIPNKESVLGKFLSTKQFKNADYIPHFLSLSLKMLTSYLSSKNNDNLNQVYEIIVFIFRNENNNSGWISKLKGDQFTAFCQAFSTIIIKQVCFGGEQSSKIINANQRFKLTTIFCLANIIQKMTANTSNKFVLSDKCIRNIVRWIMLNSNFNNQSNKATTNNFSKIEEASWSLLIFSSSHQENETITIFKQQFEKQESEINKIKSNTFKKLYQKRLLNMCVKYLNKLENQSTCFKLIEFNFSKFMAKVTSKDQNQLQIFAESQKQQNAKLVQKQYANSFDIQNQLQNKPKDWLIYKNGAKNSVYKFEYPKTAQSTYEILFKLKDDQPLSLSKIVIGFEQLETAQQNYCIPRQISVEGGNKPDELKFVGKMNQIPDNHYINFSVRTFGLNCSEVQASKLSSSLNKYPTFKYLKFTFKSPDSGYITDILKVEETTKSKNLGSSINFISIQGYTANLQSYPQIQNIQLFIKLISSFKHKQSLKQLFDNNQNIKLFKDSLLNLSILMKSDNYAEDINKFIMRVCEVNTQIGNETIEKYLHLGNAQTCSKIVSQVILSNSSSLKPRVIILHNFIIKNLSQSKKVLISLEPFLNKFCQIVYTVQKSKNLNVDPIELNFQKIKLSELIRLDGGSLFFCKYLCTIMKLEKPFSSINLDNIEILKALQQSNSQLNSETLQALVVSDKNSRSWFMQNKNLQSIYERVITTIKSKSQNVNSLRNDIETLGSLCYNSNIKSIINKNKMNLQIFNLLVSEQFSGILIGEKNNFLRQTFVNFINRSVLGSENQKLVAEILKSSLTSGGIDQNQFFVGQVFLPILNSFSKTTICVHPYDTEEKKILVESNLKQSKQKQGKSTQNKMAQPKIRLPTVLINNSSKNELCEKIKQKCKIEGGSFNLVANHGNEAFGIFESIIKALSNSNQSLLMLFKTTAVNQKPEVLGIFYKESSTNRTLPLNWNQNCLMFISKQGSSDLKFIDCAKQANKRFVNLHDDGVYDDFIDDQSYNEKTISLNYENVPFCQIYSSNMYGPSYINLDIIRGSSFGTYTFDAAEYWLFEPSANTNVQSQKQQISLTNEILNLYNISFFESQFESRSILRLLRYEKIYEFPSSLSMRELKSAFQIMKCKLKQNKQNSLLIKTMDLSDTNNDQIIQTLTKKDDENPIVDLLCEVNNLTTYLDYSSVQKGHSTAFLPKRGIMKHFEQINGVTSMIKVIKKSIEGWKNKERKQKWHQYVLQLQKFSSFPHFFGMYLKDSQTFDLLFKLLSGLPDTEQDKKWDELQTKSTQKLLKIIAEILNVDKTTQFRQYAMKHDFFKTILERLRILTGQFKRQWKQAQEKEDEQISPSKAVDDDGTKQIKKKKGVGYGNDGSSNTKWMKGATEAQLMKQFEVIELILNIIENFLDLKHWKVPKKVLQNIYESALLPYLQDSLRAGTLLQISKIPAKFRLVFKILRTLSKNPTLVEILMPVNKKYQPKQIQSVQSLIKSLQSTATIFLSCLKSNKQSTSAQKISEQLAKDIIETSKLVEESVEEYNEAHHDDGDENEMKNILELPLDKKYRQLLKDLRFDYIDMKDGAKIKHHYSGNFVANYTPNQVKMIRLAQQLADISTALPYEHTNAVFVRCDKDRVDFMQALIMGSNGTPYGHGAYLFDVYFDDSYPNGPPKVNLTTTGHGKVRFNPNLYACGKVCLSLLGTWRGSASENWDPKVSTLLQVLLSIQAIIMSEQVYFNEPGFEGEQGTAEGEKKNEAYSNIVRYCNIKFAMIDNMRTPPKGFEHIIKRHFYLKQHEIMDECKKWLLYAEKRPANYVGLVNDHNNSWSTEFKKSKNQYKDMLQKAIQELDQEFKKLSVPSIHDITSRKAAKKQKKKKQTGDMLKKLQEETQEEIDVEYDKKDRTGQQIDINDEKVKDRWSRYIGAMGIDAVSKQSKADILVFGLGPAALQAIKNLVLSGCRKLTIADDRKVSWQDLSGGFFYTQSDVGKNRIQSIMYKIRQLNIYVKVDTIAPKDITEQIIKSYSLVFVTEMALKQQYKLNEQCRKNNVKFVSAQFRGAYCRILNDFGDKFEVVDKNGQQPVQVMIKSITCATNGIVTLLDGSKHPFQDGQVVHIKNVQGMLHKQDKAKSINGTLHKVKVINAKSFQIGDTTIYQPYIRNGTAKNIKTPIEIKYNSMQKVFENAKDKLPIDDNLQFYDFSKMSRNKLMHYCFVALDLYAQQKNGKYPQPWNAKDAQQFINVFAKLYNEEISEEIKKYVTKFSYTCTGYLPPLGAYFGGFISQQIIKAITQKYKPLDSVFYMDAQEIIPEITEKQVISANDHRDKGFQIVVGKQLLQEIKNATSFMIGSGAIGCELLKNFAMIGLGTGEKGKVTLTDPDHIQNSNLNRQFLFREKHISKPKSRTAAASILLMNPHMKGHISALLQRVSQSTKNIFSNKFFESLTLVANALDNVAARRYVDQRCVENKVPLFESGTLGPKGHTQVILPYKTQSYGSQNDPVEEGQIPHCTLKLFPEETLHCIEWARDIFGKKFSLQPKAFNKVKDANFKPEKDDIKSLNECIVMSTKGPKTFEDCIAYAITKFYKYFRDDIMQLLYTYPLDAKTKDGEPFWKLPKRPPTPILKFDPQNILHCTFIASMTVLVAKVYKIPFPKNFRQEKERFLLGKQASKIKINDFVPSDQKAKSILKQTVEEKKQKKMEEEEQKQVQMDSSDKNEVQLYEQFIKQSKQVKVQAEQFEKDNDQNGHIDFIYSMANLRALNYKLDEMDWITTKIKAGRIVPALATTTTCVAGLQTLQICKYIRKLKLQSMRNSFLNLAVPSLQMSEPGEVKKLKLNEKVEVNLWDRWQIPCKETTTFGQIYKYLQQKYCLHPIGVLQGMSRIDTAKSEQEKKQFLDVKLLDRLDKDENYIDVVVLFTKSSTEDKLVENVPPVRFRFES